MFFFGMAKLCGMYILMLVYVCMYVHFVTNLYKLLQIVQDYISKKFSRLSTVPYDTIGFNRPFGLMTSYGDFVMIAKFKKGK